MKTEFFVVKHFWPSDVILCLNQRKSDTRGNSNPFFFRSLQLTLLVTENVVTYMNIFYPKMYYITLYLWLRSRITKILCYLTYSLSLIIPYIQAWEMFIIYYFSSKRESQFIRKQSTERSQIINVLCSPAQFCFYFSLRIHQMLLNVEIAFASSSFII